MIKVPGHRLIKAVSLSFRWTLEDGKNISYSDRQKSTLDRFLLYRERIYWLQLVPIAETLHGGLYLGELN